MKEKDNRYAIRKLTVGATSVLIGISFLGANSKTVKADNVAKVQSNLVKAQTDQIETETRAAAAQKALTPKPNKALNNSGNSQLKNGAPILNKQENSVSNQAEALLQNKQENNISDQKDADLKQNTDQKPNTNINLKEQSDNKAADLQNASAKKQNEIASAAPAANTTDQIATPSAPSANNEKDRAKKNPYPCNSSC